MADNPRLTIGDKDFELKPLKLNDGVELEEKLGRDSFLFNEKAPVSLKDLKYFAYVMLKRADSSIDLDWVGENVALKNEETMSTLITFFTEGLVSPKKKK